MEFHPAWSSARASSFHIRVDMIAIGRQRDSLVHLDFGDFAEIEIALAT